LDSPTDSLSPFAVKPRLSRAYLNRSGTLIGLAS
jgi:hypothetical protein